MNYGRIAIRNAGRAFSLSSTPPSSLDRFRFVSATSDDVTPIVDMCCHEFIRVEPHGVALKFNADKSRHLYEWIVRKSLHYPYSYKIIEKSSSRLVGFRTMSMGNRDESKDFEPFEFDPSKVCHGIRQFEKIYKMAKSRFWQVVDPRVQTVLRREITFVLPEYQRMGIADHAVHLGIDFQKMKASGIDGIVSEASSLANQRLLEKHGYKCLVDMHKEQNIKMSDGTKGLKVYFRDI